MSSLPALLDAWTPLVALLWAASILLLAVSLRRYALTRSVFEARGERLFVQERFFAADESAAPEPEDLAPAEEAGPELPVPPAAPATHAREAVRDRVTRDRTSAQGLIELVRALYLDGSSFNFQTLAEIAPADRPLALALVEEWLADPGAADEWKDVYDAVRDPSTTAPLMERR